jgi:hypothetical protein
MREVGQLAGSQGLFAAILFGWCPQQRALRVFELRPNIAAAELQVEFHERVLNPIRIGGTAAESAVVIGRAPAMLTQAIDKELADAKERGEVHEIVAFDAPKRAIRRIIAEKCSRNGWRIDSASAGDTSRFSNHIKYGANNASTAINQKRWRVYPGI